jgi:hypothetical protein
MPLPADGSLTLTGAVDAGPQPLPRGTMKHFSRGEAPLRPGTGPSLEDEENLQTLAAKFRANFTSGRDATVALTSTLTQAAAGVYTVGKMLTGGVGTGSATRRSEGDGEGDRTEGSDSREGGVSASFVKLAFTRGRGFGTGGSFV